MKMENKFKRENRYLVFKIKDVEGALNKREQENLKELLMNVNNWRELLMRKPDLKCVVIESDWPEYEPVWKMIQNRVEGNKGGKVDNLVKTLRLGFGSQAGYARQKQAYHQVCHEAANAIESLHALVATLEKRLEIDDNGYDGIECRDATIRLQDDLIDELKAQGASNRELVTTLKGEQKYHESQLWFAGLERDNWRKQVLNYYEQLATEKELTKKLSNRIHNQRVALHENWMITEMRAKGKRQICLGAMKRRKQLLIELATEKVRAGKYRDALKEINSYTRPSGEACEDNGYILNEIIDIAQQVLTECITGEDR